MEYRICSVETCKQLYGVAQGVTKPRQLSIWGRQMLQESLKSQGLPPDSPIERGESGKPFLSSCPAFHFNISHTASHIALALHSAPIGIDIERLRDYKPDLVRRFFHFKEAEFLEGLPNAECNEAFTRIWTLKEAFVKRSGEGIAGTFNRFAVLPANCSDFDFSQVAIHFDSPQTYIPCLQSCYLPKEDLFLSLCY